jgi:hypothetical protein
VRLLVEREFASPLKVPLRRRLAMWRHGFTGAQSVIYDFERHDRRDYLTSVEHYFKIGGLTPRPAYVLLKNKLVFYTIMARWPDSTPRLFGLIGRGGYRDVRGVTCAGGADGLFELCRREGRLAIKGLTGQDGNTFHRLETDGEAVRLDGQALDRAAAWQRIARFPDSIVTAYVQQADYAARLYPDSVNAIRLLVFRDPESGEPFVGAACHKMGRKGRGFVDRGFFAEIDPETGVMGLVSDNIEDGNRLGYDRHPDTGAPITGVQVPNWQTVVSRALEWSEGLPFVTIYGWDLVIDHAGTVLALECNVYPGTHFHQVFHPLLARPRVRAFFEAHEVVAPRASPAATESR